ncbi:MAG: WD40 repeat domain-containing protein [Myxococcota bacterium]
MLLWALVSTLAAFEPDPLQAGKPWVLRGHTDVVVAMAFSPDGQSMATIARDKTLRLWDLSTGGVRHTVTFPHEQLNAVGFSGDGRWVAVGDLALQVSVVEVATGKVHRTLAHPDAAGEVALDREGALLAVAGVGDTGAVYELASGRRRFEFRGRTAQFSDDGKLLLTARTSGLVTVLDSKSGKIVRSIDVTPDKPLACMRGDASLVATWAPAGLDVKVWKGELKAPPQLLKGPVADLGRPQARVTGVALSPDGKRALVGGGDGLVRLWELDGPRVERVFDVERSAGVAWARAGGWIAVIDRSLVKLWKP